jgi:large subunit ribosomal protein L23
MNQERIYKVLVQPHISEKAALLTETNNQYAFKVAPDATKPEIKAAVEALFNVKVESVQVVNIKGKTKRTVRGLGKRNDIRKAYVRLAEGQTIEFADVE